MPDRPRARNRCRLAGLLIALLLVVPTGTIRAQDFPLPAQTETARSAQVQEAKQQTLEEERRAIERLREEVTAQATELARQLETIQPEAVNAALVEQARLDVESAQLRRDELQVEVANAERRIKEVERTLRELEAQEQLLRNPARPGEDPVSRAEQLGRLQRRLDQQRAELELERGHLTNLGARLELVRQRLGLLQQWQSRLDEIYRRVQERSLREAQEDIEGRLQRERQTQLNRASALTRRLETDRDTLSPARRSRLETEIRVAEERANLLQAEIRLVGIDNVLSRLEALLERPETPVHDLRDGLRQLSGLELELQSTAELLERQEALFRQQQEVIQRRELDGETERALSAEENEVLLGLLRELEAITRQVRQERERAQALRARLLARYREVLGRDLLARRSLPTEAADWQTLLQGINATPRIVLHQVRLSVESGLRSMAAGPPSRWTILVLVELALLAGLVFLARGVRKLRASLRRAQGPGFALAVVRFSGELIRRNLPGLGMAAAVLLALWLFPAPQPGQSIIVALILLWVGIKIPVDLAWLILAAPALPAARQHPTLYRQWRHMLVLGATLATLSILTHLSGAPEGVVEVFDRLFMLYLLVLIRPVARARALFIERLSTQYARHPWFLGLRAITLLLPLSLLGTGVLGLVGYLNLAWAVAWNLVVSIGVLSLWLLLQGLLNDLRTLLRDRATRQAEAGEPLPGAAAIEPLYHLAGVLLFTGAGAALVQIYGWDEDPLLAATGPTLVLTVVAVTVGYQGLYLVAAGIARRSGSVFADALGRHSRHPVAVILPLLAAQVVAPTLPLDEELLGLVRHGLALGQIAAVSWLVVRLAWVMDDVAVHRYLVQAQDKQGARRVRTQMRMLRMLVVVAVNLVAISAMLMTFPKVRQLGTGLMASAGVAGLVIGIAARPFLANLIAGIQIGLTQPIRLDDEVVVENEWGRIAEINPTHVIIQIWDDRRLVVPLNYFNEKPFQNWTRSSTHLIGAIHLHVDYTFPVEAARAELQRILEGTDLWDGRVSALQVTDAKASTLELRALASARDAPTAWDLRCHVREKLIEFIQREHPECLPRTRAALVDGPEVPGLRPATTERGTDDGTEEKPA